MSNQIAYEPITVSTTAIGPTAATATARVRCAVFYVKGAAVRYRGDGTSPTASVGRPIEDGGHLVLVGEGTIKNALFIRRDSVDATIHAEYYDNVDVVSSIAASNVEGLAAHDAPAVGNPVLIGAEADEASADNVDEGDVGKLRMTLARLLKTESSWGVPKCLKEDEDDNDSNKHFTPDAGKLWYISSISVHMQAEGGTAGNREIQLKVRDYTDGTPKGDVMLHISAGAVITAGQSREVVFMSGTGGKETSYVGTNLPQLFAPLPQPFVISDAMTVQIYDVAVVDVTDDRMQYHVLGMEANE